MDQNQNLNHPSTQSLPTAAAPKKVKINPVVPSVIVFVAIAAFMAVWYTAVR